MFFKCCLLFLCALFVGCGKGAPPETRPTVLVSIPPYAYFVNKIAGDTVAIETLIPAGANPHIYEALPRDVERHQNAAVWVYLGEAFDIRVRQFFEDVHKQIDIVDVTEGIDLIDLCEEKNQLVDESHCHHEEKDLHVWLSPRLAKEQAQKIAAALSRLIPEQSQQFTTNLDAFLKELDDLDEKISEMMVPMQGKAILVSHPAFGYFCHDYGLIQLSIEVEGKDPLPQHVTQILAQAKQYQIQSVILEPQYSNKGAEMIAASLHLPTHQVDPYAEDYSKNLLKIATVICQK